MYAALRIVTEPASEPADIDTIRRHCRVDSDYDDDLLTMYYATARQWVEGWLNRALITQELRFNITNSPPPTASPLVPQSLIVFPLNWPPVWRKPIGIPRAPCVAVSKVEYGPVGDLTAADPDDYTLNLDVEPAQISLKSPMVPMVPAQSLEITFTAGYGDTASDVPGPIKHAILMITASIYENRGDVESALPKQARDLMANYRLWAFGG